MLRTSDVKQQIDAEEVCEASFWWGTHFLIQSTWFLAFAPRAALLVQPAPKNLMLLLSIIHLWIPGLWLPFGKQIGGRVASGSGIKFCKLHTVALAAPIRSPAGCNWRWFLSFWETQWAKSGLSVCFSLIPLLWTTDYCIKMEVPLPPCTTLQKKRVFLPNSWRGCWAVDSFLRKGKCPNKVPKPQIRVSSL